MGHPDSPATPVNEMFVQFIFTTRYIFITFKEHGAVDRDKNVNLRGLCWQKKTFTLIMYNMTALYVLNFLNWNTMFSLINYCLR